MRHTCTTLLQAWAYQEHVERLPPFASFAQNQQLPHDNNRVFTRKLDVNTNSPHPAVEGWNAHSDATNPHSCSPAAAALQCLSLLYPQHPEALNRCNIIIAPQPETFNKQPQNLLACNPTLGWVHRLRLNHQRPQLVTAQLQLLAQQSCAAHKGVRDLWNNCPRSSTTEQLRRT